LPFNGTVLLSVVAKSPFHSLRAVREGRTGISRKSFRPAQATHLQQDASTWLDCVSLGGVYMRFLGVAVVAASSLMPMTVIAQHTPTSIPPTPPVVDHVARATPVTVRTPVISASPAANAHAPSAPQALHSDTTTRRQRATIANLKPASTSVSNPDSEHRGFFSFLRKRVPLQLGKTCKGPGRSAKPMTAATQLQATAPSPACRVVPVTNPSIPCNVLAPCCP
jgi:hypothetical protein